MSWSGWNISPAVFKGCKVNTFVGKDYIHYLVAPANEPNPNQNHIHVKNAWADGGKTWIVCAVKTDGIRGVNRRELIESINRQTGLGMRY